MRPRVRMPQELAETFVVHPWFRILRTPMGWAAFVTGPRGLLRVYIGARDHQALRVRIARDLAGAREDRRALPELAESLQRYFAGEVVEPAAPLDDTLGTEFERRVWSACRAIGYGQRRTYKQLARAAGSPAGARAVGMALGRNPCPIIVPCHRVVRSDGHPGGFSAPGGVAFKRRLLQMEAGGRSGRPVKR